MRGRVRRRRESLPERRVHLLVRPSARHASTLFRQIRGGDDAGGTRDATDHHHRRRCAASLRLPLAFRETIMEEISVKAVLDEYRSRLKDWYTKLTNASIPR